MEIKQLNKYAIIITICIAVLFIFFFTFLNFKFLYTDVDSARYMLSALIQSEAAIISIVVTLSLVAVQLAASSYSVRVIDVFRKTPALWMLLTIYGIVIFLGLVVLGRIDLVNPYICKSILSCQSNLELSIASTYSLGILAYVALAAYIWVIIGLLKPSAIMMLLAEDISKENILEHITEDKNKRCSMATSPSTITNMFHLHTPSDSTAKDPMLPIIDIINGSLMNYDYGTLKNGLRIIECRTNHIFIEGDFKENEEQELANHLLRHLTRIRRLAIDKSDEYSTNEVIKTIQIIGVAAAKNKLEVMAYATIMNLGLAGIEAAKGDLEWSTKMVITAIMTIAKTSDENELKMQVDKGGWWKVSDLEQIGKVAIENKLKIAAEHVAAAFGNVGTVAAKNNQNAILLNIIKSLSNLKKSAEDNDLPDIIKCISDIINQIEPVKSKLENKNCETGIVLNT